MPCFLAQRNRFKTKKLENMKTKIKTLILSVLILILASLALTAQERLSIELYQDARLAVAGGNGYKAGTIDVLARFTMQGKQDKLGYFTVSPTFEYAEIDGIYKRYSLGVGYSFNKWLRNSETQITLDYGWIDRFGKTSFSASATGAYKYLLSERIKLVALLQLTDRKDLKLFYDKTNTLKLSGFIGIEIDL